MSSRRIAEAVSGPYVTEKKEAEHAHAFFSDGNGHTLAFGWVLVSRRTSFGPRLPLLRRFRFATHGAAEGKRLSFALVRMAADGSEPEKNGSEPEKKGRGESSPLPRRLYSDKGAYRSSDMP